MTLVQLYPPIAAALIVGFLWAVVEYRLYKRDLPAGPNNESVLQALWLVLPTAATGCYFWWVGIDTNSTSYVHIFFCTLAGLGFATIAIFGVKLIFYDRTTFKQKSTGYILFVSLLFVLGIIVGPAFIQVR
ncbi:hypothetical protein [Mesorhizobium japonicum]|uniref:hypothetical protein n=1 Tax=Mesorhizobium japonicum TaxID=2066070 RepID=UPI0012FF5510|nr:hypothetical protein [Mesorhizobium japonicum]